jgi:hypothetical protein
MSTTTRTTDLDDDAVDAMLTQALVKRDRLANKDAKVTTQLQLARLERDQAEALTNGDVLRHTLTQVKRTPASTLTLPKLTVAKPVVVDSYHAMIYPDCQIWYYQDRDGIWRCTHDEAAMDLAVQITAFADRLLGLDDLVNLGDAIDNAAYTTHRTAQAMLTSEATQRSIRRSGEFFEECGDAAPGARKRFILGNHEDRILRWFEEHCPQLIGVCAYGEDEPMFSISKQLGLKKSGWEVVGPYPAAQLDLSPNLRCKHGPHAKAGPGETARAWLRDGEVSTIAGHSPHAQVVRKTFVRNGKERTYIAYLPSSLCKTTGCVPSQWTGSDEYGRPDEQAFQPWEQGVGVVSYDPRGHSVPRVEHIPIAGGRAVWRGHVFEARCDPDGYPL